MKLTADDQPPVDDVDEEWDCCPSDCTICRHLGPDYEYVADL